MLGMVVFTLVSLLFPKTATAWAERIRLDEARRWQAFYHASGRALKLKGPVL